jgi:AbrB family looped-hinge helix DNA binding protein
VVSIISSITTDSGGDPSIAGTESERNWQSAGIVLPVKVSIDSLGRIVVPKQLRDALGLTPGSTLDVSRYGAGLQLVPAGRSARLVEESGVLVVSGDTEIDDDDVFDLVDSGRR